MALTISAPELSRRSMLTGGLAGIATAATARPAGKPLGRFDRAGYNRYISLMNAGDASFLDYYADDVDFVMGIRGRENVRSFYARQQPFVREKIEVEFFCADAQGAASQVLSEIRCILDCDDTTVFGKTLRKGEVQVVRGCLLYKLDRDGRIARVMGPPPEVVQPWGVRST